MQDYILRLALAFVLGAAIGAERQLRQKNAGLRTNTLVSTGSAAFILLSLSLTGDSGDPSRVASQIVTGVGFLGGGLIIKDAYSVRGLNTAATIWCSAAVGAMTGTGLLVQASVLVAFIVAANCLLRPLGDRLESHGIAEAGSEIVYILKIRCREQSENRVRMMIVNSSSGDRHMQVRALRSTDDPASGYRRVEATVHAMGRHDVRVEKLAGQLTIEYGITNVEWEYGNKES